MTKHFSAIELKDVSEDDPSAMVTKALDDLSKTVDERFKALQTKGIDPKLLERLDKLEVKANRPAGGAIPSDEAKEIEKKALNAYLRGGIGALDDLERKTLAIGGSPATGAYVVAPEYSTQIIGKLTQFSPMRSVASVMSVGAQKVYIPRLNSALSGGWVSETGTRSSSNPIFEQVEIDNYEHAVIVPVSQQLLRGLAR
jgi:HK97 family phage major capsid protein